VDESLIITENLSESVLCDGWDEESEDDDYEDNEDGVYFDDNDEEEKDELVENESFSEAGVNDYPDFNSNTYSNIGKSEYPWQTF
jgi:hypothetical protein